MASPAPDILTAPLEVVDALFQAHAAKGGEHGTEWGVREHFVRSLGLEDEQAFARIPCLNDQALADSVPRFSLVRYRAMVQDVFEPEIYIACLEEHDEGTPAVPQPPRLVTTKYRECAEPAPGRTLRELGREGRDGLGQRGACYCVPIPGETMWAQQAAGKSNGQEPAPAAKPMDATADAPAPPSKKRAQPEDDVEMGDDAPSAQEAAPAPRRARSSAKKTFTTVAGAVNSDEFGLNLPLPWEERRGQGASTACIVKLYDADAEALRVCDTVEVLGVLCVNPELANFAPGSDGTFGSDARHPSTALVPRLHAILVRKLPVYHPLFPFTPDWLSEARLAAAFEANLSGPTALAVARRAAFSKIAPALGGDLLATEYVLMQFVSRSFAKHGDKSLGCWSLNLTKWPQGLEVRGLGQAVSELVPRVALLDLSVKTLNEQKWRPRKDFTANRLVAGQLQLAPGTLLMLDETKLAEGHVTAQGLEAVSAIQALVTDQSLNCDFQVQSVRIPLELSCVLVSQGRSIVKGLDVRLPVQPEACAQAAAPESGPLEAARLLLGLLTRSPKALNIPEEVTHQVSEDFAGMRRTFQVPPELIHTWMSLARASCLSHGETELTHDRWQAIATMERERLRRCQEAGMLEC